MTEAPRWRQAYDAAERRVTPHADRLVRTVGDTWSGMTAVGIADALDGPAG